MLLPILLFSIDAKIDSLLQKLEKTDDSVQKIELLIDLSIEYTDIDTSKSFEYGDQAIELSNKLGDYKAEAYGNLGYINYILGNDEKALKQLFNALSMIEPDNKKVYARLSRIIGFVYIQLHEYDLSFEYFDKALNIFLELDLKSDEARIYNAIGDSFSQQDELKKSLEYYFKSIEIYKSLNKKKK